MRIALLIFPLLVFSLLFSCSDMKSAKTDHETSVFAKDNADSVETDTMESNRNHLHVSFQNSKSLNYKFLVPVHYHYINPGRMIDSSWVEIYQKGKNFYRAKAVCDYRRLKGKLTTLSQLHLLKEFTPDVIERLRPYVEF